MARLWLRAYSALLLGLAGCANADESESRPELDTQDASATCPERPDADDVDAAEQDPEQGVREAVKSFYAGVNSSFACGEDFATEDWNHIGPTGVWTRGREDVLARLRLVYSTILEGVTDAVTEMSVLFATDQVAVVTTMSKFTPWSAPNRMRSSFVVALRNGRWLVMQNQANWIDPEVVNAPRSDASGKPVGDDPEPGPAPDENAVRQAVGAFYAAFNAGSFEQADYATENWNFIDPAGNWNRGRETTLEELQSVASTFLKGATHEVEDMSVRFATPDVAIVTATSYVGPFTAPNGLRNKRQRVQTTFVVVQRSEGWLLLHTHNTIVTGE
jgi:uncharacterized protein (TIGR02246 family)